MTQFIPIIHNTDNEYVKAYNLLITKKPVGNMPLAEKIEAQRVWAEGCRAMLDLTRAHLGMALIETKAALPVRHERMHSNKSQRSMADTPLFDRDTTGRLI